jgi:uncharacterized metal-binding protein YceD (DUF177 family)
MQNRNNYEFSRPFPVDKLRDRDMQERIEANDEEREALAARLDIVAIKDLTARLDLQRIHSGKMVEVRGRFSADIVQSCVVTLEPFETHVEDDFIAYFVKESDIPKSDEVDIEDDNSPDPINEHGEVDLGELTAQHLLLALDPYPRKPGVTFEPILDEDDEEPEKPVNPFAVLAEFRAKKSNKTDK